ncbi:DUF1351 domain-containing protein [Pseudoflavonifractor phocaeensis]|uniref:DUF1351 domain-containing protein n=1 Tax=Pseudoflavonifractor phocaeensis TaxID=1870988 RepID=UPI00313E3B0D
MDTLEFVMSPDVAEVVPAVLGFNFEEMKSVLQERLRYYSGLVVTEGAIKAAKQDRADLNKLREALEAKRKEVKKVCLAPYNDFEAKVKELVGMIEAPISAIDGQLKEHEDRRREAKYGEIDAFFREEVGDLMGLVPLSAVWKDEWLNAGTSMKKIKEEVSSALSKIRADLKVLGTVEAEYQDEVKVKYLEALDVSAALAHRHHLKEQAQKFREMEEKRRRVEALGGLAQADACGAGPAPEEPTEQEQETVYYLAFECSVTKAQAAALSAFMRNNNITYRRIYK